MIEIDPQLINEVIVWQYIMRVLLFIQTIMVLFLSYKYWHLKQEFAKFATKSQLNIKKEDHE